MLEVQENNQANFELQCSRGARQCQDEVRVVWQCQSLLGKVVTTLSKRSMELG